MFIRGVTVKEALAKAEVAALRAAITRRQIHAFNGGPLAVV
jgi:hypothetical protein